MNTIVILTHHRPECLWLCLESLVQARGIQKYHIYVATNKDCHPDIEYVTRKFLTGLDFELDMRPKGWMQERANCEAWKTAADMSDNYFISVAEDEEVSRDWLEALEYIAEHYADPKLFGISPTFAIFPIRWLGKANDSLIAKANTMTTQSTLIFKDMYNKYLRWFFTEEYYLAEGNDFTDRHPQRRDIIERYWPGTGFQPWGLDGLVERIVQQHGLHCYTMMSPRAHQIGFWGGHMATNKPLYDAVVKGDTAHRARALRNLIDSGRMASCFGDWHLEYHDIKPDHTWETLIPLEQVATQEGGFRYNATCQPKFQ